MKIVFMGTPDFAVKTLEGVISSGEEICLVITQPDKPKGRGLKSIESPVKKIASKAGIEIETPVKLKNKDLISKLRDIKPDLFIVSAYGKIIPNVILDIPSLYSINVHASLLPKYRGAAPINWAIINGESETGITIMKINEKMDAGEIMFQEKTPIHKEDNASSLHDRLAETGKINIQKAIERIKDGSAKFTHQNEEEVTFAPMLKKEDGMIKWELASSDLYNFIRGMNPWPGAHTFLKDKMIKIFRTETCSLDDNDSLSPGEIAGTYKEAIMVKTGRKGLLIKELQEESRKRLKAQEFIKGRGDISGLKFSSKRA